MVPEGKRFDYTDCTEVQSQKKWKRKRTGWRKGGDGITLLLCAGSQSRFLLFFVAVQVLTLAVERYLSVFGILKCKNSSGTFALR